MMAKLTRLGNTDGTREADSCSPHTTESRGPLRPLHLAPPRPTWMMTFRKQLYSPLSLRGQSCLIYHTAGMRLTHLDDDVQEAVVLARRVGQPKAFGSGGRARGGRRRRQRRVFGQA